MVVLTTKKSTKVWNRQKALEAIKKLKGSGNGRLVEALLKERSTERAQKEE